MKSFGMSVFYLTVITLFLIITPSISMGIKHKNEKETISITYPITTSPTLKIVNACTNCSKEENTMTFSNRNSNNAGSPALGKKATIVGKFCYFNF